MQGVFASVGWVQKVEFRGLLLQLRVLLRVLGVDVLFCFLNKFYQVLAELVKPNSSRTQTNTVLCVCVNSKS